MDGGTSTCAPVLTTFYTNRPVPTQRQEKITGSPILHKPVHIMFEERTQAYVACLESPQSLQIFEEACLSCSNGLKLMSRLGCHNIFCQTESCQTDRNERGQLMTAKSAIFSCIHKQQCANEQHAFTACVQLLIERFKWNCLHGDVRVPPGVLNLT